MLYYLKGKTITMKSIFKNLTLLLIIWLSFGMTNHAHAQDGDQILDGIGETALIARYTFKGNIRDWSRNNFHLNFQGSSIKYEEDEKFGEVLALSGVTNDYLTIPSDAIADMESMSISTWIYPRSKQAGQTLFEFGKNPKNKLAVSPLGLMEDGVFHASLQSEEKQTQVKAIGLPINKWSHIAIVINIPAKSYAIYINNKLAGESKELSIELDQIFDQDDNEKNLLNIGKSFDPALPNLNALLHDFRFYRIALSENQVNSIFENAAKGTSQEGTRIAKKIDELPTFPASHPQLYNEYLIEVPDIEVETSIGNLPRLPSMIEGKYKGQLNGPKVKVIWPADRDNNAVLQVGTYTITGKVPGTSFAPIAKVVVKEPKDISNPIRRLTSFALNQVTLQTDKDGTETKFIENRDKFITTLAETDPDSFLYMFRNAFGQPQPSTAKPLGVWDSQETKLRGHATGHYLTAIAQAYAGSSYDKELQAIFFRKMDYMVNTLYDLAQLSGNKHPDHPTFESDPTAIPYGPGKSKFDSDLSQEGIRTDFWNWGKGYISAYPPDQFIMLEQGANYGGQQHQVWAPYYTLHKILAGLIDIYEVTGNKKALDVAIGMSDWVYTRLSQIPNETLVNMWSTYIAGEYGGMNESMAKLYRITANENYMMTAKLFDNVRMFFGDEQHSHGLAKNVDTFRSLHANQHIPQIVGSIEMYRASSEPEYFQIADNFWYKAVNDYMYSIGGVAGARNPANAECFIAEPSTLFENGFSTGGQNETCATYNMLKLTNELFLFDQRAELMDYYERGLYNHILASVAKDNPGNTYHVPLRPASIKHFGNPRMTGFTCCNGTAIESSTKLQNAIYFKSIDNKELYINLFVASTLDWTEQNFSIEQSTSFPKEDQTLLTVKGNGKLDIKIRVPSWATKGFKVSINGKLQKLESKPGTYLTISRKWKTGDTIKLEMPFQFHLDPVMDQQNIASLFYGPILLAAQEPEARTDWRKLSLDASDISSNIETNGNPLEFVIDGVLFKPFYDSYERHSVYLDFNLK